MTYKTFIIQYQEGSQKTIERVADYKLSDFILDNAINHYDIIGIETKKVNQ